MRAIDLMIRDVVAISPDTPVLRLARLFLDADLGAVPVIEDDGRVAGIVTRGDLLGRRRLDGDGERIAWLEFFIGVPELAETYLQARRQRVADVMSTPVVEVAPTTPVEQICELFERRDIKRVPVVEDGRLVGLVTRGVLLRAVCALASAGPGRLHEDRWIKHLVQGEFRRLPGLQRGELDILVVDGVVHLWGRVASADERRRLTRGAGRVPGVTQVRDHMLEG